MKFSKYNLVVETDNGIILYNTRQNKSVKIYKEPELSELRKLMETQCFDIGNDIVKALYKNSFIVDDDVDEFSEVKKEIETYYDDNSRFLNIMLYVTENCNFRCVYCFEKHVNKCFSAKNWDALYKYIEKSLERNIYDTISLSFFGGEPLLEVNAILKFLDKLEVLKKKYPNVEFCHDITTNGYLLTPNIYDKLVEKDVVDFMISVDGFADTHNQTRPLANGKGTWDKIIENLRYINTKDDLAEINIRNNVTKLNANDIESFISWIQQNFNQNKFHIDFQPVSYLGYIPDKKYILDANSQEILDAKAKSIKKAGGSGLKRLMFACSRIDKSFFTISVDGKITKCDHAHTNVCHTVGVLTPDGDFEFNSNYKFWTTNFETERCKNCIIYPLCGGRHCPQLKLTSSAKDANCYFSDNSDIDIIKNIENTLLAQMENRK